jgi:hypothetical protein
LLGGSCRRRLARGGEVWVTIKNAAPYDRWGVESVATEAALVLVGARPFDTRWFAGYAHQTTMSDAVKLDTADPAGLKTLVFRRVKGVLTAVAASAGDRRWACMRSEHFTMRRSA